MNHDVTVYGALPLSHRAWVNRSYIYFAASVLMAAEAFSQLRRLAGSTKRDGEAVER